MSRAKVLLAISSLLVVMSASTANSQPSMNTITTLIYPGEGDRFDGGQMGVASVGFSSEHDYELSGVQGDTVIISVQSSLGYSAGTAGSYSGPRTCYANQMGVLLNVQYLLGNLQVSRSVWAAGASSYAIYYGVNPPVSHSDGSSASFEVY